MRRRISQRTGRKIERKQGGGDAMYEKRSLISVLGEDAMRRLVAEYGGELIYVPQHMPVPDRDERIREQFTSALQAGGTCMSSYTECAEVYGLSVRRVQEIVAG